MEPTRNIRLRRFQRVDHVMGMKGERVPSKHQKDTYERGDQLEGPEEGGKIDWTEMIRGC
jgi:hypothetical protein